VNDHITKRAILCFLLAGALGLVVFAFYYSAAFPEASLDLKVSRGEVVAMSRSFLLGRGFDLSGYRSVAVFNEQRSRIDFLERNLGLEKANTLFRTTVPVWRWSVRWFKELEELEYAVEYTPDGRLASFQRELPEAAHGARLGEERARRIAEEFLGRHVGLDLTRYKYIERTMEDRPDRLDQSFVWKLSDFGDYAGSEYRIQVGIQGDKVGSYLQWLKIPQAWSLSQKETEARRDLLAEFDYIPISILFLAMVVVFFWRVHAGDIRWRRAAAVAAIAGAVVFLTEINKFPFAFLSYDTTQSLQTFRLKQFASPLFKSVGVFLLFIPLFSTTEAVGRLWLPGRTWISNVFSRSYLVSGEAWKQTLLGYGMGFAAIGYVTAFYVLGQRLIHAWSPVEVSFSNTFSTYFPSLESIYTGFSAALLEELTFRLFATALLFRLTKRFWLAVIIPAAIWGFAHTTYPQEPIWIRGVELTAAGIVYGWVFLRYGLVTTLVSHFIYNVFVGIVPELQSARPALVANGLFALTLPLLALASLRCLGPLASRERWKTILTARGSPLSVFQPGTAGEGPAGPAGSGAALSWKRLVCYMVAAAALYGASFLAPRWDFYRKEPPVTLTGKQGSQLCEKYVAGAGFDAKGYTSFTVFRDHTDGLPAYVIDRFGIRGTWEKFRNYYRFRPEWITRWYGEKKVQNLEVAVDEGGRLMAFKRRLGETDPGARLTEDSAREIARTFLSNAPLSDRGDWEYIETDTRDLPHRLDYRFTYRDKGFQAGDLRRKVAVVVSGDTVTGYGPPWYDVPDDWTRRREVLQKGLRNLLRQLAAGATVIGLTIFFIVHVVILLRRRVAGRPDVTCALWWALVLGAVPAILEFVNNLPRFYYGYFNQTEQSIATYTLTRVLGVIMQVIWMPVAVFFIVFLARIVLRAWVPERAEFGILLAPLRPSRWNSTENRQGVLLGLAMTAATSGLSRLADSLKVYLAPGLFSPSAGTTDININQVSEILDLADRIPQVITGALTFLVLAAAFRRFLPGEKRTVAFLALFLFIISDTGSISWHNVLVDWFTGAASIILVFFMITRVVRWNIMAYAVWLWVAFNLGAVSDFKRFAFSPSPEFFWPSIEQMAVLVLPVAIVFLYGWLKRQRAVEPQDLSEAP
jgi:hypothetical protein